MPIYRSKFSGDWRQEYYDDGSTIVHHRRSKWNGRMYAAIIERCRHVGSPRTQWHIVSRQGYDGNDMEPLIRSGPYPNLKAAKIAYLLTWVD